MPLEHSEVKADGDLCLKLMKELQEKQETEEMKANIGKFVEFAADHLAVIEKYGRYPSRNKVLGR